MMNLAKIPNKILYQKFIIKISIAVLIGKKKKKNRMQNKISIIVFLQHIYNIPLWIDEIVSNFDYL